MMGFSGGGLLGGVPYRCVVLCCGCHSHLYHCGGGVCRTEDATGVHGGVGRVLQDKVGVLVIEEAVGGPYVIGG